MSGPVIQKAFLERHLQFLLKVPQMSAKLSKKRKIVEILTFSVTSRKFKEKSIG